MRHRYTAVIGQADVPNKNGRIYPRAEWDKAVEQAKLGTTFGQIDMPDDPSRSLDLNNVSHFVKDMHVAENGDVLATIEVLDTEAGCNLIKMMSINEMQFRTAGIGTVTKDANGNVIVTEFTLTSVNAVSDGA